METLQLIYDDVANSVSHLVRKHNHILQIYRGLQLWEMKSSRAKEIAGWTTFPENNSPAVPPYIRCIIYSCYYHYMPCVAYKPGSSYPGGRQLQNWEVFIQLQLFAWPCLAWPILCWPELWPRYFRSWLQSLLKTKLGFVRSEMMLVRRAV